MRLTFKNDLHGNLWLLYCSELKLEVPPGEPDSGPGKPSGLPALSPEKSASGSSKGAPPAAWVERLYTTSPFRTLRYRNQGSGLEKLTSGSDESAMHELRALLDEKIKWGPRARIGAGGVLDGGNKTSDGVNKSSDGVNERSDGSDGEDRLPGVFVRNFGALEPLPKIVGLVEGDVARGARAAAGFQGLEDYLDGLPSLQSQLHAGGEGHGESGSEDEGGYPGGDSERVGEEQEGCERSASKEAREREACGGSNSDQMEKGVGDGETSERQRLPKVGVGDRPGACPGESDCDAEVARVMGRGRHRGEHANSKPSKERDSAQGLQPSTSMSNGSSRGGSRGVKRDVIEERWKPQGQLEKEIQHAFESVAIERKPGGLHWGYENEQKPETFARRSKSPVNSGAAYKDDSLLKAFKEAGVSVGGRSRLSVARRARSREAASRLGLESDNTE